MLLPQHQTEMSDQPHASSILDTRKTVPGNHWIGSRTDFSAGVEVWASSKQLTVGNRLECFRHVYIHSSKKKSIKRVFLRPKQPEHRLITTLPVVPKARKRVTHLRKVYIPLRHSQHF